MSRMMIGASPRLISSHNSTRGFDIRLRPIATICCWPPESAVLAAMAALVQHGEQPINRRQVPRAGDAAAVGADQQILLDRKRRK